MSRQLRYTQQLNDLSRSDVQIAGGKGASLGDMLQAGLPVPSGFVVTANAFHDFVVGHGIEADITKTLAKLDYTNADAIDDASELIRERILTSPLSDELVADITYALQKLNAPYVAVRSSATGEDSKVAAWAGQLDSFLFVAPPHVAKHVQYCWASRFNARALSYRLEKNLAIRQISVAVVLQNIIEAEVSGVAFSVHPLTGDQNQIVIEAGWGMGEAVVSGAITPDKYLVDKNTQIIIESSTQLQEKALHHDGRGKCVWRSVSEQAASQQKLTDQQIHTLSELVIQIEQHFDMPCDIEWVLADDKFQIVQSRPITTL